MENEYYTPEAEQAPVSNTEILLRQLISEQGSNRRSINAIVMQLKKDAEERERTYAPVRFLCWVQIIGMGIGIFCLILLLFSR